jgi:sugar phosphate isomerase/epimerase
MNLSVLATSLPLPLPSALRELARLGFACVDVVAVVERDETDREALADAGLVVGCVALGRGLPEGCRLDTADVELRRRAVAEVQKQLADAAYLGAKSAYLVPGKDAHGLVSFADACAHLAAFARGRMIELCVEPMPGSALPSAAVTLDWLRTLRLEAVKLLLDVGHCLISGEEPARVVEQAADRLGYVHLDDNDGHGDLHWPLLTGQLTEEQLRALFAALRGADYAGGIALELNASLPEPARNLSASKAVAEALFA